MNNTLEHELTNRIEQHKENILKLKIKQYYQDLQNTGIRIPEFMLVKPEILAEKEIEQLKRSDRREFERLYDIAWWEYAEQQV